jgi:hypothetical protein
LRMWICRRRRLFDGGTGCDGMVRNGYDLRVLT